MRGLAVPLELLLSKVMVGVMVIAGATAVLGASSATAVAAAPAITEAQFAPTAFAAARKSGQPVEILAEKSATTRVWANPNGRRSADVNAVPVRLQRDGKWAEFDMTLVKRPDGTIAPRVHPNDLVLSAASGAGEHDLATMAVGGDRLGMGWTGRLPEPVLKGATATYPEVIPGVDLLVEARSAGFEQFFIIKDRAAAARLAGLKLPMRSGKTGFATNGDGSAQWTTSDGRVVARAPMARMWDSQGLGQDGERKRRLKVDVNFRGARSNGAPLAEVGVDQAWLNDPATVYPVTVDPGIVVDPRVSFDEFVQNTISISDNQSETQLKLGFSDDSANGCSDCRTRSYLRFDGWAGYQGAKIYSAQLKLWEFHSWSCTQFGWRATRTDYVSGSVQWGSEPAWQEDASSTTETKGHDSACDDGWVSTDVAPVLDDSFANGWDSASMVIHAVGDNSRTGWSTISHNSWKKFDSNEGTNKPYIHLEYDHIPTVSNVSVDFDGNCGTGVGMRKYLQTTATTPTFRAYIKDDDKAPMPSTNVKLEVKATTDNGATVLSGLSQPSAPNSTISVQLSQALNTSKVYTYQVRPLDLNGDGTPMEYGAWSPPCELGFDTAALAFGPTVEGIPVVVEDEVTYRVLDYGKSAQLTFRANPADVGKVAAFRYGFSPTSVASPNAPTVAAGPDGSATAVVTNWEVDGFGVPTSQVALYVRAVTITGNNFTDFKDEEINQRLLEAPAASHIAGDVNGDGKADLAGYREISATEGLFYTYSGKNDGTLLDPAQLMKTPYVLANSKVAQGDFTGDGKTDFAVFTDLTNGNVDLRALTSDGNGLKDVPVWDSITAGMGGLWSLCVMRVLVGDADADGKDDLVIAYPNGTANWKLKVFKAYVDDHTTPADPHDDQLRFLNPTDWTGDIGSNLNNIKLVMGQYDNKPGADVAEFQDMGSCRTNLFLHESITANNVPTGAFAVNPSPVWDSNNTSAWCWGASQFVGGHYGGGQSGIVATYDFGGCSMGIYTFSVEWVYDPPSSIAPTPHWFPHIQQWGSPGSTNYWCSTMGELGLRDITGDGREDLFFSYRCCGAYQQRVWMFQTMHDPMTVLVRKFPPSTTYLAANNVFAAPVLKWQGGLGPVGVGSVKTDGTTRYQLVAKHSGKCVSVFDGVNGGSTSESSTVSQRTCFAGYLNEQFTLEQRGAAYVRAHPVHDQAKCLNVLGAVSTNGTPIVSFTCTAAGQSNESWQVEYVSGLSTVPNDPNEIAVRLVSNLSGKCLDITGVSMADGAVTQQYDCLQGQANQTFFLRPLAPTNNGLLAQWKMGYPTAGYTTLVDSTGRNAWANINGPAAGNYQNTTALVVDGNGFGRTGGAVVNTAQSFTVSAWVKLNALGGYQTIVAQEGASYCAFYLRLNPDNKWHLELLNNINGGSYTIVQAVSSVSAVSGSWVHVVGVYDAPSAQGRLYVNGVADGTVSVPSGVSASGPIVIGSAWSGGGRVDRLAGSIDDVRLWERILTPTEISALYSAGAS